MMDILHNPEVLLAETQQGWLALQRSGADVWSGHGIEVRLHLSHASARIELEASNVPVRTLKLRWHQKPAEKLLVLGDHWERAYGDLEWRGIVPERIMPWYFLTHDGGETNGYGVKTGARSFCYWQLDADGITLTADVRCGSEGVQLGGRSLHVADIVVLEGKPGESAFAAAQRFCTRMCEKPVLPPQPVYGGNNWYYAYGNSSHHEILEDSRFIASLSPSEVNRPFMVVDDGWQLTSGGGACNGGPWTGNKGFPGYGASGAGDERNRR